MGRGRFPEFVFVLGVDYNKPNSWAWPAIEERSARKRLMSLPMVQYCSRCGQALQSGGARYVVTIQVIADFDGTIGPPAGEGEVERLAREIEGKSEEELMNEVAQKLSFVICKPCRDAWVQAPLGSDEGAGLTAGRVH